jgi:hypothetical protein
MTLPDRRNFTRPPLHGPEKKGNAVMPRRPRRRSLAAVIVSSFMRLVSPWGFPLGKFLLQMSNAFQRVCTEQVRRVEAPTWLLLCFWRLALGGHRRRFDLTGAIQSTRGPVRRSVTMIAHRNQNVHVAGIAKGDEEKILVHDASPRATSPWEASVSFLAGRLAAALAVGPVGLRYQLPRASYVV